MMKSRYITLPFGKGGEDKYTQYVYICVKSLRTDEKILYVVQLQKYAQT